MSDAVQGSAVGMEVETIATVQTIPYQSCSFVFLKYYSVLPFICSSVRKLQTILYVYICPSFSELTAIFQLLPL